MRSLIIAAILIIAIIVGGIFLYRKSGPASQNSQTTQQGTPQTTQEESTITYGTNGFSPATLTIKAGTKVTWTNKSGKTFDVESDPHQIHTSYPPMNFGAFSDGSSVSLVFDKTGTYRYHNHLNPSQTGTVIVQ